MNIVLWIFQGLLAVAFLLSGGLKATQPKASLAKQMSWVNAIPFGVTRFIGVAEILGGIGLILPMVTNIAPKLTIAAAAGLAVTMIGAIILHTSRKEYGNLIPNIVLLLFAVFVIVGRTSLSPITA